MSFDLSQLFRSTGARVVSSQPDIQQQRTFPDRISSAGTLAELIAEVKKLAKHIKQSTGRPVVDILMDTVLLNKGTDGDRLASAQVPNGFNVILRNMDIVYTATGSYRVRWQSGSGAGQLIDIIENTSTNLHYLGYIACPPGTSLVITQGATVSGTGNIDGVVAGEMVEI